jgi:hypothetical protein
MLLLELAAQSVRGFTPSVRVALKTGYLGLKSPSEIPAPLAGLVAALCYPDGRGGDAAFLAPGAKAGRAGLSIQANDQTVWRLVRDLGGSGGLHKLNRTTNQYELVTQDAAELAQARDLRAGLLLHGPPAAHAAAEAAQGDAGQGRAAAQGAVVGLR